MNDFFDILIYEKVHLILPYNNFTLFNQAHVAPTVKFYFLKTCLTVHFFYNFKKKISSKGAVQFIVKYLKNKT